MQRVLTKRAKMLVDCPIDHDLYKLVKNAVAQMALRAVMTYEGSGSNDL